MDVKYTDVCQNCTFIMMFASSPGDRMIICPVCRQQNSFHKETVLAVPVKFQ